MVEAPMTRFPEREGVVVRRAAQERQQARHPVGDLEAQHACVEALRRLRVRREKQHMSEPAHVRPLERRHAPNAHPRRVARPVVVQRQLDRDRRPLFPPDVDQVAVRIVQPDPDLRRLLRRLDLGNTALLQRRAHRLEVIAGRRERDVMQPLLRPLEQQQTAGSAAGLQPE
jgi:hypothetical protein